MILTIQQHNPATAGFAQERRHTLWRKLQLLGLARFRK